MLDLLVVGFDLKLFHDELQVLHLLLLFAGLSVSVCHLLFKLCLCNKKALVVRFFLLELLCCLLQLKLQVASLLGASYLLCA